MAKRNIFTISELRIITDAFYKSEKNNDTDWVKYVLKIDGGVDAYDKYFEHLTERTQDYFEEMADVAVRDCWDDYEKLEADNLTDEQKKKIDEEINGWIEAALDEFLA